jgi:hypothetical protein
MLEELNGLIRRSKPAGRPQITVVGGSRLRVNETGDESIFSLSLELKQSDCLLVGILSPSWFRLGGDGLFYPS